MTKNICFDERLARSVTTKGEAELCLLDFIREGAGPSAPHHIGEHSHGFDLYLPWFMEVIEFRDPYPDVESLGIPKLQQLYMDASWNLVMKGILRPGPKLTGEDTDGSAYGKGFSVIEGVEF
jgi:hypothetical protein